MNPQISIRPIHPNLLGIFGIGGSFHTGDSWFLVLGPILVVSEAGFNPAQPCSGRGIFLKILQTGVPPGEFAMA
jgi:hypothetical protein